MPKPLDEAELRSAPVGRKAGKALAIELGKERVHCLRDVCMSPGLCSIENRLRQRTVACFVLNFTAKTAEPNKFLQEQAEALLAARRLSVGSDPKVFASTSAGRAIQ